MIRVGSGVTRGVQAKLGKGPLTCRPIEEGLPLAPDFASPGCSTFRARALDRLGSLVSTLGTVGSVALFASDDSRG